jgi:hypothetical protein
MNRMNRTAHHETLCHQAVHKVNYFPSFQTLLAIRHADSSEKVIGALHQAAHRLP